jgi:hypothetical protein
MANIKAKLKFKEGSVLKRFKAFTSELMELCKKYEIEPQMAQDDATNDNFIVINVKDFIRKKDIKIKLEK